MRSRLALLFGVLLAVLLGSFYFLWGTVLRLIDSNPLADLEDQDSHPLRILSAVTFLSLGAVVLAYWLARRSSIRQERSEQGVRQSEARKAAILEVALDAIITIDHEGRIVEVNSAFERTFGYPRADLIGTDMAERIVPPAFRQQHQQGLARYLATREGPLLNRRLEMPALRADGSQFPIELTICPIPGEPPQFTAYIRDLTAARKAQETLAERTRLAEYGAAVGASVTRLGTLQEMLQLCAEATVAHLDAAFARIWTLSEGGDVLELQASAGMYTHRNGPHGRVPVGQLKIGLIAQSRQPHLTNAVIGDSRVSDQEWARREGMVAFAGYPLVVEDRLVGVIALFARHALSEVTLQALASVADEIAVSIDRKQTEAEGLRLLREAQAARERAEASEAQLAEEGRRKDSFLALLGHELRNPLAPIRNAVSLLNLLGDSSPQLGQAREMIDRQVTHLTRLVDELLDASRIANGKVQLQRQPLDLGQVVRATAEDQRPVVEASGLRLEVAVPAEPVWVEGDAVRLAQVVSNLLGNAAKFTDAGGRVGVRVAADAAQQRATVTVSDTGLGIEPGMLEHLFRPFAQADRSLDRAQGGLGLGLAVVQGLVRLHGGDVRAASAGLGQGSEFTLWLPLTQAGPAAELPPLPQQARVSAHRILIIEDNRDAAESLKLVLEMSGGHTVAVAYSGTAGVELARTFAPDLVLCDLGLPGLSGFEVARRLRADPATAALRLVAVSGYGREEDQRDAHQAGFDAALVKPIDPAQLMPLLTGWVRQRP